ncbi:MAG: hypothetical protein HYV40_02250 [Candidatus Levybacteria bacterium]|nr:hypothetical protein [Candidatus Levybacteria bacterium]
MFDAMRERLARATSSGTDQSGSLPRRDRIFPGPQHYDNLWGKLDEIALLPEKYVERLGFRDMLWFEQQVSDPTRTLLAGSTQWPHNDMPIALAMGVIEVTDGSVSMSGVDDETGRINGIRIDTQSNTEIRDLLISLKRGEYPWAVNGTQRTAPLMRASRVVSLPTNRRKPEKTAGMATEAMVNATGSSWVDRHKIALVIHSRPDQLSIGEPPEYAFDPRFSVLPNYAAVVGYTVRRNNNAISISFKPDMGVGQYGGAWQQTFPRVP